MSDSAQISLIKDRNIRLFLITRLTSVIGSQILAVSVGWHVYQISNDVLNLGLIGLFQFLAFFSLFLFAGYAVDRLDRRFIMGVCNIADAMVVAAIGVFFLSQPESIWPIFPLVMAHAAVRSFTHPAQQAILPNIVPEKVFPQAIALASSVLKLSQLAGPAIGGLLIAAINEQTYFVAAGCFIVAALTSVLLTTNQNRETKAPLNLSSILGGLKYTWREKLVLAAISIDLMVVLLGSVMALLPVFVKDILQVGPEYLGFLRAAPGFGALIVALVLARYTPSWHLGRGFLVALLVFGLSIIVFAYSTVFWLSLVALMVYGATDMLSVYIRMSLVQLRTPDALRGRVSALNSMVINASNELGDLRAGGSAALIGVIPAVAIGGVMTMGVAVLWWMMFPQLRKLEKMDSV